jgi:hypothetical protein
MAAETMRDFAVSAPAIGRTPAGRRGCSNLTCRARCVFGQFDFLIVDFISLFLGFISLFGRLGNLHSEFSNYQ